MHKITDDGGQVLIPSWHKAEPNCGSVVLTQGEFGTAWQRQFSTGLWHRAGGGKPHDWAWMLTQRNLVLVYDAAERGDVEQTNLRIQRGGEVVKVLYFETPSPPPNADVIREIEEINRKRGIKS